MSLDFDGLDYLGAETPKVKLPTLSWSRGALAIAAGALGAALTPKHPVLMFLGVSALASNAHAVYQKERTFKNAVRRMGCHVVAVVGSLSVPKHPALGYIAGAVAADMLIDGEGGGIIEEWVDEKAQGTPKLLAAESTVKETS